MLLTVRTTEQPQPPRRNPVAGRSTLRDSIYPHRSVRSISLTPLRIYVAAGLALLLSALMAFNAAPLMELHSRIVAVVATAAGLPLQGWEQVPIFFGLGAAPAPVLFIPPFQQVTDGARLLLLGLIVLLLIVSP